MNKKITATTLSVAMAATMAPAIMQTAPVNAASSAVQTLAGWRCCHGLCIYRIK